MRVGLLVADTRVRLLVAATRSPSCRRCAFAFLSPLRVRPLVAAARWPACRRRSGCHLLITRACGAGSAGGCAGADAASRAWPAATPGGSSTHPATRGVTPPILFCRSRLLADPGKGCPSCHFPLTWAASCHGRDGTRAPGPAMAAVFPLHWLGLQVLSKPACFPLCPEGNCPPAVLLAQRSSVRFAMQPAKTTSRLANPRALAGPIMDADSSVSANLVLVAPSAPRSHPPPARPCRQAGRAAAGRTVSF
jgi:hypothetical protein